MGRMMEALKWLESQPDEKRVGILVSGDPLMYSLYRLVRRTFSGAEVEIIPGVGSIQMFAAKLGETLEDAMVLSAHGRDMGREKLASAVTKYSKLFLLCDREQTPGWLAKQLMEAGMDSVLMAAGSYISYPEESIVSGSPEEISLGEYPPLSLVMIKHPEKDSLNNYEGREGLIRDSEFLRNQTPMTKEEIRWIAVGKMNLTSDAIVWDVGAGTGSVSIECAGRCPLGKVIAIEKNSRALEVLYPNCRRMAPGNIEIVEGAAPEVLDGLPKPTHVFIGGAGGALRGILEHLCRRGPGIRAVISCVTLETMMEAYDLSDSIPGLKRMELVTIRIEAERPVGSYHLMEGGHPVTLIVVETCEGSES
jgi:precorrin-6Y C5,15-methyltransferase (decarboxylating)